MVAGFAGGLLFGPHQPHRVHGHPGAHATPAGRVFGALTALASAGIPIGAVLAGVVVQQAGLVPTIVGMGVLYLLVPLGMFFNQSLRQMDTQRRGMPRPGASGRVAEPGQRAASQEGTWPGWCCEAGPATSSRSPPSSSSSTWSSCSP